MNHENGATAEATTTFPRECLLCYVDRMLTAFGCDTTLRWAVRWRDRRAPRAMGLESRLHARGGYCDCEIFGNGWDLANELKVPDGHGNLVWPEVRPRCIGGLSTQPCDNWVPRPPGW
jgi:hypothetical protein